jgi:DHA2 family multidrug resistance protein-like MFS transporter
VAASAPAGTPPAALRAARDTLGGAVTAAGRLPGHLGPELLGAARAAFIHGLNCAALGAAITMILGAVLSAAFFRRVRAESPAPAAGNRAAEAQPEGLAA